MYNDVGFLIYFGTRITFNSISFTTTSTKNSILVFLTSKSSSVSRFLFDGFSFLTYSPIDASRFSISSICFFFRFFILSSFSNNKSPFAVSNLNTNQLQQSLQSAIPKNGSLISGLVYVDYQNSDLQIFNSTVHLKNQESEFYHKHHLVPFGEYVPLQKYFHFLFLSEELKKITEDAVNFSQGTGPQTLLANNFSFSPLICYEVIFSTKIIDKKNPPDILINLTNDGWFGKTIGPYQHLAHTQMRAIEYRKPLLRVAGTGISAYINEYGKIVNHIPLQKSGFLDVKVYQSQLNSLYAKLLF